MDEFNKLDEFNDTLVKLKDEFDKLHELEKLCELNDE